MLKIQKEKKISETEGGEGFWCDFVWSRSARELLNRAPRKKTVNTRGNRLKGVYRRLERTFLGPLDTGASLSSEASPRSPFKDPAGHDLPAAAGLEEKLCPVT